MGRLFGTDGVRGVANRDPMTPQAVTRLGVAAGLAIRAKAGEPGAGAFVPARALSKELTCVIGRDTRISSEMLENALAAGLTSAGVHVLRAGVIPTPGVSFLAQHFGAAAGGVISASHNPFPDNGVKFFSGNGQKLSEAQEMQIETVLDALVNGELEKRQAAITGAGVGSCRDLTDAIDLYCQYAIAFFGSGRSLRGVKIVVDCANGASHKSTPQVLRALGAHVIVINDAPDGKNINAACGSTHVEVVQEAVRAHSAHVGISHDGDADRVMLADDKGSLVDGDFILGIVARHLKSRNALPKDTLVTTVMANLGLEVAMRKLGIRLLKTQVGDRYVHEQMLKEGIALGGEQSGHVIIGQNPTGDGLLTALQILKIMVDEGQTLSQLHGFLSKYPQILLNVRVREKVDLERIPGLTEELRSVEQALGADGRVLLRYSGTEPLARVMVEGAQESEIRRHAEALARRIKEAIGEGA
jgi:phosphoglucosamine mutase